MEDKAKSLERFVDAQAFASVYERALAEVKNGLKIGHWIWYIFPQMKGLGMSDNSHYYGIDGLEEARAYLQHPILGKRLREITTAFLELQGKNAEEVFGYLDAIKVRSCMTLFDEVAEDELFMQVLEKYYQGEKDKATMRLLYPSSGKVLLGAIAGDVIGSVYEFRPCRSTDFDLFLDYSEYKHFVR